MCRAYSSPKVAYSRLCQVVPASTSRSVRNGFCLASDILSTFTEDEKFAIVTLLFESCATSRNVVVPGDFLSLCIKTMFNLSDAGRSNVLYHLAKALGTKKRDGNDTLLPVRRFPMGLIEHCANFYTATTIGQVCILYSIFALSFQVSIDMHVFECLINYERVFS